MMMKSVILLCLTSVVWAEKYYAIVKPPLRIELEPPEETKRMSSRDIDTKSITMPVDHFDPINTDTFQMRYLTNDVFFGGPGSPIFIFVGGEWTINSGWLLTGNMYEFARENKGYMIYTEHRYYGTTLPYTEFTTENLRFLNVDQALGDLVLFIDEIKKEARFANSEIILCGCSYAANMVVWFKQRYPNLVKGVVASSGPIKGKVNYHEYLEVVHETFLLEGGEKCIAHIREGIQDTVKAMDTAAGRRELERAFRLCDGLDYDNHLLMGYFSGMITWAFSGVTQNARPGNIIDICDRFETDQFGTTPMEKLAGYIAWRNNWPDCVSVSFDMFVNSYKSNDNSRAWYYQTCTEYGYYQISAKVGTVFDPLHWLDVDFYVEACKRVFDTKFDTQFVYDAVDRVNLMFGGLSPVVNNTINTHGHNDPWRALGVYNEDLSETSPTFVAPRASHCFDIQSWSSTDTIAMTNIQQRIRRIVRSWLN